MLAAALRSRPRSPHACSLFPWPADPLTIVPLLAVVPLGACGHGVVAAHHLADALPLAPAAARGGGFRRGAVAGCGQLAARVDGPPKGSACRKARPAAPGRNTASCRRPLHHSSPYASPHPPTALPQAPRLLGAHLAASQQ